MKLKHSHAILFSGFIWIAVGILLLTKGMQYIALTSQQLAQGKEGGGSLLALLQQIFQEGDTAVWALMGGAFILGVFKGRVVLKKSVNRVVGRIRSFPSPLKITQLYSASYVALLVGMMVLGMVIKYIPIPLDIKGFVDLTVGVALVNGAMLYVRAAIEQRRAL